MFLLSYYVMVADMQSGVTGFEQLHEKLHEFLTHEPDLNLALSGPLVYIVALLPPFVDPRSAVVPQLVLLGAIAISLDAALALIYIAAGSRLAAAMARPHTRRWLDSGVGLVFIAIAIGILAELVLRGR